jgi:hypothetical protein
LAVWLVASLAAATTSLEGVLVKGKEPQARRSLAAEQERKKASAVRSASAAHPILLGYGWSNEPNHGNKHPWLGFLLRSLAHSSLSLTLQLQGCSGVQ